jgi:hypothetical protein
MSKFSGRRTPLNRLMQRMMFMLTMICIGDAPVVITKDKSLKVPPMAPPQAIDFDDILILAGAEGFTDKLR